MSVDNLGRARLVRMVRWTLNGQRFLFKKRKGVIQAIKLSNSQVVGWEPAIRGCRNPLNSWAKSDSRFGEGGTVGQTYDSGAHTENFDIGPNDHDLMMRLRNAGTDHRKYLRMIMVYVDITAPLYWHKEMDTYRAGVEKNSCSTMHKIADKEFTLEDFSYEHLFGYALKDLVDVVCQLNYYRDIYIHGGTTEIGEDTIAQGKSEKFPPKDKRIWWQMIQLLPSSYNQKRTFMFSYEALANMYKSRRNHKLDEWRTFCNWIECLPYSELITGETENAEV